MTITQKLREALRKLEWAGTIWCDEAVCLFCGNVRDGLPAIPETSFEAQEPLTHASDCEWVQLIKESEGL